MLANACAKDGDRGILCGVMMTMRADMMGMRWEW